jgi:twitching motility protein PilT
MVGTPAVRNLIKDGKSNQLRNVVATGAAAGMRTLETDLRRLVREGVISIETATASTVHPTELADTD